MTRLPAAEYQRETFEAATRIEELEHKIEGHKDAIKDLRKLLDIEVSTLKAICLTGEKPIQAGLFDDDVDSEE